MVDLVVFDLAGTTVKDNRDVHRVLQAALRKFDVDISLDDANAVMGIPKPVAIRELMEKRDPHAREITHEIIADIHAAFVNEMVQFYRTDASVGEKEGVSDTFKTLKMLGVKVAVDTGFSRDITNALLHRLRWMENGLIDCSVTSDEVSRGRPYPDMVFEAMRLTNVHEVKRVAKVGDTISDLEEGISAGCSFVIGVTTGAFSHEALSKSKHSHLIEHITEVIGIVANPE